METLFSGPMYFGNEAIHMFLGFFFLKELSDMLHFLIFFMVLALISIILDLNNILEKFQVFLIQHELLTF